MEGQLQTVAHEQILEQPPFFLYSVTPTPAYHVDGYVNNVPASMVIDTGAAVTLLRKEFWLKTNTTLNSWKGPDLVGANGTPITVCGTAAVVFKIGSCSFSMEAVVSDVLTADAILGLDFLEEHKCTIAAGRKLFTLRDGEVSVPLDSSNKKHDQITTEVIHLSQTVSIPALSEVEVMAHCKTSVSGGSWLVENSLGNKGSIVVARALITPQDGCIPVRLVNLSSRPSIVYKGSTIGRLEVIDEVVVRTVNQQNAVRGHNVADNKKSALWDAVSGNVELNRMEQEQLYHLLMAYHDIFSISQEELGHTGRVQHEIHTGNSSPIRQHARRIPSGQREEARKLVQEMLKRDIIQPSSSPWSSPIVLVRKKDGSLRFCVDYRKVNAVTKKDAYPLPRVDETLDTLSGSQWFSTLDLLSGYWQVEMSPTDREKTAFSTPEGLYEFKVMPFGLCNAPSTFQRLMDSVLMGLHWSSCLVYIDDVIVPGRKFKDHLQNLKLVFDRFREAGLKLHLKKCKFGKKEVTFLGHVISAGGIAVDPTKTDKIATWPEPQCQRDVQQFLGLANYYRRFIKDFATIAKPLHHLTEKTALFRWTVECQDAFHSLKQKLISPPVLAFPDHSKPFILDSDASDGGIGGVLSQKQDDELERVIAYGSRVLSKTERNYCVTRRELLAAVYFIEQFRPYLLGRHFTLRSDHGSLTWLRNFKEPEGQLARWIEKLEEYSFSIVHRPGRSHTNADALSRLPCTQCGRTTHASVDPAATVGTVELEDRSLLGLSSQDIRKLQLEDWMIGPVLRYVERDEEPDHNTTSSQPPGIRRLLQQWKQLELQNGILWRQFLTGDNTIRHQLIVPQALRDQVLDHLHGGIGGGHLGEEKTRAKLQERFYWPGQFLDVRNWCQSCSACTTRKTPAPKRRAPLGTIAAGYPMQIVAVDILGPLPRTEKGNSYVLAATDYYTRWVEAYAIPDQGASTVAQKLVDELFCRFSPPEQLHSDQGRQFESDLVAEVCKLLKICKTRTTPYHPQGDGLVERFNRTLLDMLATTLKEQPTDWEDHLRKVCLAYNSSIQSTTGYTPFFLMFGRNVRLPVDLMYGTGKPDVVTYGEYATRLKKSIEAAYLRVRENVSKKHECQKQFYDRKCHGDPFEEGDLVWLHSPVVPRGKSRKFHHPWTGPWRITERLSDVTYRIRDCNRRHRQVVVHFDRLKPCTPGTDVKTGPEQPRPPATAANVEHYQLEVVDESDYEEDQALPLPLLAPDEQGKDAHPLPQHAAAGLHDYIDQEVATVPARRYPLRDRRPPVRYGDVFTQH